MKKRKKTRSKRSRIARKHSSKNLSFSSSVPSENKVNVKTGRYTIEEFYTGRDFTAFLNDVAELSPTRLAVISSKTTNTLGSGFVVNAGEQNNIFAKITNMVKNILGQDEEKQVCDFAKDKSKNLNNLNLLSFLELALREFFTIGNTAVIMHRTEVSGQKQFRYWREPFEHCKLIRKDDRSDIRFFAISEDFAKGCVFAGNAMIVSEYPYWTETDKGEYTVIHVKNMISGRSLYGLPISIASIYHQMTEALAPQSHNTDIENGFIPKFLIESVEPESSQDQMEATFKLMCDRWTGGLKNSKLKPPFIYREVDNKDCFSSVQKFDNKPDFNYFKGLSQENERQILKSEIWHRSLIGVGNDGGIGNNSQENIQAFRNASRAVIEPTRTKFLSEVINVIIDEYFKHEKGIEIGHYLTLQNSADSALGEINAGQALTVNEVRQFAGLSPLAIDDKRGNMLIGEITKVSSNYQEKLTDET